MHGQNTMSGIRDRQRLRTSTRLHVDNRNRNNSSRNNNNIICTQNEWSETFTARNGDE